MLDDPAAALPTTLATSATVVEMWTDGACKGNPGPGGWGAWMRAGGHERELWGGEARVRTLAHDHKRYVGAQIGIYNPQGVKVGKVGALRNTEYLYVVSRPG